MYNSQNAFKQTAQINAILVKCFGEMSKASLSTAAQDLHDIAWECQNILHHVEAIRKERLTAEETYAKIIDILVGIESHINKNHLRSLKRFAKKIDLS